MLNNSKMDGNVSQLRLNFKRQLAGKVEHIEKLWLNKKTNNSDKGIEKSSISELHKFVQVLAGSAVTYGAETVGLIARDLAIIIDAIVKNELDGSIKECDENVIELIHQLKKVSLNWKPSNTTFLTQNKNNELNDTREKNTNLIYLVTDDEGFIAEITVFLEQAGYLVRKFKSLSKFEEYYNKETPIALIMNLSFNVDDESGVDFIKKIKNRVHSFIPVYFISNENDIQSRLSAAQAGAYRYFLKPVNYKKLINSLDSLILTVEKNNYQILMIDDEELLNYYEAVLSSANMTVTIETRPFECLNILSKFNPDVIVLDLYMPECTGPELAQIIRQDDQWALIPIMFLSSETNLERQLDAMDFGGDDFLVKPVSADYLISAISVRARRARLTKRLNNDLELALRENEFQLVTMNQHDIVSSTDVAGKIISVNDKFCHISGYSRTELVGETHNIINSGYHPDSYFDDLWKTISDGQLWHGIICNRKKDGSEYWVDSTIVPFLDLKGKPYKYVSARTDITALRESENRLLQSQEFAKIAMWDWNVVTGEFYWSDLMWSFFGYKKNNTSSTYSNFFNAIHPDDYQKTMDSINKCIEQGAEYNIEHRVVWSDGSEHWLHQSGNVVRCEDGTPLHMLGVVQDISINKNAKLMLQDTEQRNRLLLESVGEGIFEIDVEGNTAFINPKFTEILGYTLKDLSGQSIHSLIHHSYPDGTFYPIDKCPIYNALITGEIYKIDNEVFWNKEGKKIPVEYISTPVIKDNEIISVVTIFQDISKRIKVEDKLVSAKEQAIKANFAKSEFLASMSHELRTPMNAIMGFSQLLTLDEDNKLNDSQMENVQEINNAASHLLELINEVLDLAKIESGQLQLSYEQVYLSEIIFESIQLISPLAIRRGIKIIIFVDEEEFSMDNIVQNKYLIRTDAVRLKQVILNLLSNAVKYNKVNGSVKILCEKMTDSIRISITDSGDGLTEEQILKLFKPFERLDAAQTEIEGAGIGLVITKNIIDKMEGKVGVESHVGLGTTFWFELPGVIEQQSTTYSNNIVSRAKTVPQNLDSKFNILYIEDNPANLRLITQLLNRIPNVHVWSSPDPVLGLELANERNPDLILLDINLPGLSGYEVLKYLRKSEVTCDTPVIAVSANAMDKDIEKGLAAGFDEYITKPVDVSVLLETVKARLSVLKK